MHHIIDEGIQNGVYIVTENWKILNCFIVFYAVTSILKYEHCKKMLPISNQPRQLYGTAKTHKFDNIADITVDNLKFHPIIAQFGTCTYNAAQVSNC